MKTPLPWIRRERSGSALIAVMGVALLISMTIISLVALGRQQIYSAERLRDLVKAKMIAEAGANQAYNVLKTNFAARLNPDNFPLTSFDGGTYDATVTNAETNKASITCVGVYQTASADTKLDIRNFHSTLTNGAPTPGQDPFGYAMLAGANLGWSGNSDMQTSNGWLHCNGIYSANGDNTVRGNVEASGGISMVGGATITGKGIAPSISGGSIGIPIVTNVPLVSIPDIDLTPYYNAALAAGQVYSGNKSISGTVIPTGGIMWVNGTLSFGNGTYTGCFIATGDIQIKTTGNGTVDLAKVNRYPLLVSRDGNILIKQANIFTFHGLIYCKTGSFDKQGNGDPDGIGSIIAAGNVTKNGGWGRMTYEDSTPVPPGGSIISSLDNVVVTAWQE